MRRRAQPTGMQVNPRECMFCHDGLPEVRDQPVNLAFMDHIERRVPCRQAFDIWRSNMQTDFLGD